MAPEQIAGLDVSIKSDIYSLGLIIYELFSGQPAFDAKSNEEFAELHRSGQPVPLSKIVNDVDQEVEQIVESCLRKHAHDRPASALAVAAALPGTDLLAAALAANVTPSPEMVAAARPERDRSIGANYLALIAVMLFVGFAISRDLAKFPWERPSAKPPIVLVERAREFIKKIHPAASPSDSAHGYCDVDEAMALATGRSQSQQAALVLAGGVDDGLVFWYRQSASRLEPSEIENLTFGSGRVRPSDPSSLTSGQISAALDLSGRLLLFVARIDFVGPHEAPLSCDESEALWKPFLDSAGLSLADLTVMEPLEVSIVDANQRCAWTAPDPRDMDESLHVDFMARNGIPVFFAVRKSADSAAYHGTLKDLRRRKDLVTTSLRLLLLAATIVAIPWAWRNYRAGRNDRRGAWRLVVFVATIQLFVWALRARHSFEFNAELLRACLAVMRAIATAALVAVFYMALEPYARRNWPQILIAWSRVLSGRVRDKLVGEHVLVGVSVGCFWALILAAERSFVDAMGWAARHSVVSDQFGNKLLGARAAVAGYLDAIPLSIVYGLLLVLVLTALRVFVRRPRWAAALFVLLLLPLLLPRAAHIVTMWLVVGAGVAGVAVWVISRFGLLSLTIAFFVVQVVNTTPITVDFSVWYAEATFCTSMIVIAITVFGYWAARRLPIES